ncbi:MAG: tetratricopeptide repeat protein [Planctomycetaceae bacterium]|nr:tetratricopeptide repeat protein [Planctomycetaceae bacterium]
MIWRKGFRDDNSFVEAGPTLGERFAEVWHGRGAGRFFRLLWFIATVPFRILGHAFGLLLWWRHAHAESGISPRRLRHLLQGLPAVVVAIAVLAVAGVVIGRESHLRDAYRIEAVNAFRNDRPEDARIYYERLFRLDGGTAETRLFLGLTLEKLGNKEESHHLIHGVADGDAGGDPRANRWVAAKLLSDPKTLQDRGQLRLAYQHLAKAERGLPQDANVKLDLVKYHLAMGEIPKAIPKLVAAASADPALNYDLSRLYVATGQSESARQAMERAERHFRKELETKSDDRRARLLLATCVANLGRFEEAVAVLNEGLAHDPEGPYGPAIARIYIAAYDRRALQQPTDNRAMIAALREALRFDPKSVDAAVRLATFGEPPGASLGGVAPSVDPKIESEARDMLEGLLAAGEQPPAVHMALGLKSWRGADLDKAQWHFERAYELDPTLAGVANNLAWVLSHQKNADLERALEIIDPIVERFPDVAHFRDTRGEIYLRMNRWNDALQDLERALPSLRENPRIHESLASVYEGLDQPEMAKRHRQEAAKAAKPTQ